MTKFSESIIGKIKCEHLAPVPRWHFLLKKCVFCSLLTISVLLGSLSVSVIMHIVNFGDFDIFAHLQGNLFTSAVMLLPYFWLASIVIFVLVAYYNWKHTKLGYRFKRRWIVLGSVVLSISLGSVLYVFGMGNKIDNLMANAMPFYSQSKHDARLELWMQPENGLLVGKVINIDDTGKNIDIEDEYGKTWFVSEESLAQNPVPVIEKGKTIKILGEKREEHKFSAKEIRSCGDCHDDKNSEIIKDIKNIHADIEIDKNNLREEGSSEE